MSVASNRVTAVSEQTRRTPSDRSSSSVLAERVAHDRAPRTRASGVSDLTEIVVQGAREHNLKNVDLTIPRDSMVVFTGLSGSGKSSLAFDTIFAEGQRRYVESLSLSLIHI